MAIVYSATKIQLFDRFHCWRIISHIRCCHLCRPEMDNVRTLGARY